MSDSPELSNRLENPPCMVDRLHFLDTPEAWMKGELRNIRIAEEDSPQLVLSDTRENAYPRRGTFESAEIETEMPFTELIPSWNAHCPPDTGLIVQVRARDNETGEWSPYLYFGHWGRIIHWPERTVSYENGIVHVDFLILRRPANAYQVKVSLYSFDLADEANPSLRRVAVSYSGVVDDPRVRARLMSPAILDGKKWARSLDIPFLAQGNLDRSISGSTCSPTSVSMVMEYNGIRRPYLQNALDIYDPEYGIFGNWSRGTAQAGQFGLDAWVRRFRNWDQVKAIIAEDVAVIASIRFNEGEFPSNPLKSTGGHLIVIRGFTDEGDVIVNDPAHRENGEAIVYKADELARAWFDKGGVAYIITDLDSREIAP